MNQEHRLAFLFEQYYHNRASDQELEELRRLLNNNDDKQLIVSMQKAWDQMQMGGLFFSKDQSKMMLEKILNGQPSEIPVLALGKKDRFSWKRYAVAAAILLILVPGGYFLLTKNAKKIANVEEPILTNDVAPGGNKAILTLADGNTVILDSSNNGRINNQGGMNVYNEDGQLAYKNAGNPVAVLYNKISVPRAGQFKVILADGTRVWLNASSTLRYPTVFKGDQRIVELTGEGYFEVQKNNLQPFLVKVGKMEVQVLGTSFNIMSYEDEDAARTTLAEGSVKVFFGNETSLLKPGQQAVLDNSNNKLRVKNADVEAVLSWKNGQISFSSASLPAIMRQISRWYDVDIHYTDNYGNVSFNGIIDRNLKLSNVLDVLEVYGIKTKLEGKTITVLPH